MTAARFRMDVSAEEVELVNTHRRQVAEAAAREELKRTCKHSWSYVAAYRGEQGYLCRICGEIEYRS